MHSRDAEIGKKYMGAEGGTRVWLRDSKVADPPSYRTKEVEAIHAQLHS